MDDLPSIPGTGASFEDAGIIIFGAPFDGTSSYRQGSRGAPLSIRTEFYGIENYSPDTDSDLEDMKNVCDLGDAFHSEDDVVRAHEAVGKTAAKIVGARKTPFMIGGEHSLTLPVFSELLKIHPKLHLIHFDAHTDLRDDYLGEKLSHASVVRRIWDLTGDGRIFQFGIRSGDRSEFCWAAEGHTSIFPNDFHDLEKVLEIIGKYPVYLSVDLDVMDPSVFPGTGTPEPGGVRFRELLDAIRLAMGSDIVGADIVELAPNLDPGGISTVTACKILREMLLRLSAKK